MVQVIQALQPTLEGLKSEAEVSRSRPRPAICRICGRFHEECLNLHYKYKGRRSKKKARICPDCQETLWRKPLGKGLARIGPSVVATYHESCPYKTALRSGPPGVKVPLPLKDGYLIGVGAHHGLQMSVSGRYSDSAVLGDRGVAGKIGGMLYRKNVAVEQVKSLQELIKEAAQIVLYARNANLVTPITTRREHEPDLLYAKPELYLQVKLSTLLEWVYLEVLKDPAGLEKVKPKLRYDAIMQGRADLTVVHKDDVSGELKVKITDYKTYVPSYTPPYEHAVQLRLYGLWAAWAFRVPCENVAMELIFVNEGEHKRVPVTFTEEDPLAVLRLTWQYLKALTKLLKIQQTKRADSVRDFFPPKPGSRCGYCEFLGTHCKGPKEPEVIFCPDHTDTRLISDGKHYFCPKCKKEREREEKKRENAPYCGYHQGVKMRWNGKKYICPRCKEIGRYM